jgi:hypothetical protein
MKMLQKVLRIMQWISIPVLLLAAVFAGWQIALSLTICLAAVVFVQRAARNGEYCLAVGFVAVTLAFSPYPLITRIFLLMALTCTATLAILIGAFRRHAVPAALLVAAVALVNPVAGSAQNADALDVSGKLRFHVNSAYGPTAMLGTAAYAGILQSFDGPREWGQGAEGYGKRFASMAAWAGVHSALAFGLDSALHQDPRYARAGGPGVWRRAGHAVRGTILTRTDAGGETLSTWRLGSAYGSAILSNQWYPDRLNTVRLDLLQGSVTMGFDLVGNLAAEFWPDVRRKVFRRK